MRLIMRITCLFLHVALVASCTTAFAQENTAMIDAPTEESADVRALIDRAADALQAGKSTNEILADPSYMAVHPYPRFRGLIRDHAKTHTATLVTPDEPGTPLVASGTIRAADGKPLAAALVYAYQTSAKGWYSDRAAHFRGGNGDFGHARLFGYLRTDDAGRYELRTIRPAGYPRSELPQHIHIEIIDPRDSKKALFTEICFEDDPRLTGDVRREVESAGFVIARPQRDANGVEHVTADFTLRK
jgi:protocatechuate 3,4-dioxygenase beta subunit